MIRDAESTAPRGVIAIIEVSQAAKARAAFGGIVSRRAPRVHFIDAAIDGIPSCRTDFGLHGGEGLSRGNHPRRGAIRRARPGLVAEIVLPSSRFTAPATTMSVHGFIPIHHQLATVRMGG